MNTTEKRLVRRGVTDDFEAIVNLLQSEALPTEDITPDLSHFFVIEETGHIIAAIGLEIYKQDGLLRSLVVDRNHRNRSLAKILLNALLKYAAGKEIRNIYLITTTAEKYFAKNDFTVIRRETVPATILSSPEFTTLCPSTAIVMMRKL